MTDNARGNILVAIQFALLVAVFFVPSTHTWALPPWAGVITSSLFVVGLFVTVLAIVGLGTSLTANPVPRANGALKTRGLYGVVRHPIYSGILLAALSFAVGSGSLWSAAAALLVVVLFMVKARFEERMLLATYPDYAAYAARVGRFVPWVGRRKTAA